MEALETLEFPEGIKVKIYQDEDPINPRKDYDNVGTMVCWHTRYDLGDETVNRDYYNNGDEVIDEIKEAHGPIVYLPLYLYEHSGMTIRTYPFGDPWDSGQVGWIYVTQGRAFSEYGDMTGNFDIDKERIAEHLIAEVSEYDQYLTGDIYGYVVKDSDGKCLDSCWGFYGMESVIEQGKESGEYWVEQERNAVYANF